MLVFEAIQLKSRAKRAISGSFVFARMQTNHSRPRVKDVDFSPSSPVFPFGDLSSSGFLSYLKSKAWIPTTYYMRTASRVGRKSIPAVVSVESISEWDWFDRISSAEARSTKVMECQVPCQTGRWCYSTEMICVQNYGIIHRDLKPASFVFDSAPLVTHLCVHFDWLFRQRFPRVRSDWTQGNLASSRTAFSESVTAIKYADSERLLSTDNGSSVSL
jgi:hypothetical protein